MSTTLFLATLAQAVVFTPNVDPGRTVRTEVRTTQEYLMESYVEQIGDQSRGQGASGAISTDGYAAFEDEYREGRVVRRHFEEIDFGSKSVMTLKNGKTRNETLKFASLFESYDILFTWIESENEYARRYDRIGSTEEPLKHLRFEADGRSILPEEPVEVGAQWSVDGPALAALVSPSGDLALRPQKRSVLARSIKLGVGAPLGELFGASSLGSAQCELTAVRTREDGARLAEISIRDLGLQAVVDQTRDYERLMARQEKREAAFLEGVFTEAQLLHGEGTLTWNLTAGRLETLELRADQRVVITVQKQFGEATEDGMQPVTRIQSVSYTGLLKHDVQASEEPQ